MNIGEPALEMAQIELAGGITLNPQRELLVLYRPAPRNRWETPGGKIEPGETAEQAVVREFAEELAITVEVQQSFGTTEFSEHSQNFLYHWFLAPIIANTPTIQEPTKHERWAWLPWSTLTTAPISVNLRAFLARYPTVELVYES